MSEPQIIRTPGGEELVVIPRAEYEALVATAGDLEEELADIAIADECLAALARGDDEPLPIALSALIHRGKRRLPAIREWRGLSLGEVAGQVGIPETRLAEVEAGDAVPDSDLLARLAKVLDVPVGWVD